MTVPLSFDYAAKLAALLLTLITAPAIAKQTRGTMEGDVYVAPLGGYRCEIKNYDPRDVKIDDRFGPAGGTSAFKSFFDIMRVDVEQIEGGVQPGDLEESAVRDLLTYYFNARLVPLVKSGVEGASVISNEFSAGPTMTYRSVMRLPLSRRKGGDMLRGAIQYTNGEYMYVVSVSRSMKPERGWSESEDAKEIMKETEQAFSRCQFPLPVTPAPAMPGPSK